MAATTLPPAKSLKIFAGWVLTIAKTQCYMKVTAARPAQQQGVVCISCLTAHWALHWPLACAIGGY